MTGNESQPSARLMDAIEPEVWRELVRAGQTMRYQPGEVVVEEGSAGREVFILMSGRCDVHIRGQAVSRVEQGEMFGEIAALHDGVRTATVSAVEPVEVLSFSQEQLHMVLRQSPRALSVVLHALAERARTISDRETMFRQEQRDLSEVQSRMLASPEDMADSTRFSLEVQTAPLALASGDAVDVIQVAPERFAVAIVDVMGHGARTAPTGAMIHSRFRELVAMETSPQKILAAIDAHLTAHGPAHVHATMVICMLDGRAMTLCYSNAAHPCPIRFRGQSARRLAVGTGPLLGHGFGAEIGYPESGVTMRPGDRLLLYTDGLSEARRVNDANKIFLTEGGVRLLFRDLCRRQSADIASALLRAVEEFRAGSPAKDDATALVVHVK